MTSRKWTRSVRCWLIFLCVFFVINCVLFLSLRHDRVRDYVAHRPAITLTDLTVLENSMKSITLRTNTPKPLTVFTAIKNLTIKPSTAGKMTDRKPNRTLEQATRPITKYHTAAIKAPNRTSKNSTKPNTARTSKSAIEQPNACQSLPEKFPYNQQFLPCAWRTTKNTCSHRNRVILRCNKSSASILVERVQIGTPPVAVAFNDSCLLRVVRQRCSETGRLVPRVVHYIQFSPAGQKGRELGVHTFLSLLSALRFLQPCLLLFHADYLPLGKHWEALLQLTSRVVHVHRTAPDAVFGHVIKKIEHKSDVARLEAMKVFGGIYIDTDEVILQPMNDLMQHHVTMAWEKANHSFGNGLFLAEPNSSFVNAWYNTYRKFTNVWWSYFSTTVPHQLYRKHPEMKLHVVDTFFRPNLWNITELFYKARYDWSNHYAIHLYFRRNHKFFRGNFEMENSTLGEISRYILFGDKNRCL